MNKPTDNPPNRTPDHMGLRPGDALLLGVEPAKRQLEDMAPGTKPEVRKAMSA